MKTCRWLIGVDEECGEPARSRIDKFPLCDHHAKEQSDLDDWGRYEAGTGRPPGCCDSCGGTGSSYDASTSGLCWDCRGTGHVHEADQDDLCAEAQSRSSAVGPDPCYYRRDTGFNDEGD